MKTFLLGAVLSLWPATDAVLSPAPSSRATVARGDKGKDGGHKKDDEEREEDLALRTVVGLDVLA
ncbi:MAG: hypothetical protein K1X89_31790 [Myxococcaceae bacterium]|nr:hypothetical protein [Myxococcaceae bacterium]